MDWPKDGVECTAYPSREEGEPLTLMEEMPDAPPTPPAPPPGVALERAGRLESSLKVVAGRARFLALARAVFKLGVLAAGVWMGSALILGSRVQVPAAVAVPVVAVAWGSLVIGAVVWLRPVFRRQTMRSAAYLVDAALPDTQERMSSAIELSQERDAAFRGSPELVAVLMRQAEHHAEAMDPSAVISGRDVFRWFTALCGMAVVWFVLLVLMTPNVLLGLQRTFVPWKATSGLPAPTLEVTPGDAVVAQGQAFTVNVEVQAPQGLSLDSEMTEAPRALLTQHLVEAGAGLKTDKVTVMERKGQRSFWVTLENVQQGFTYQVSTEAGPHAGAAVSRAYTVVVEAVPGVAGMQVVYTAPKYTRLAPRTDNAPSGAIEGLEGSTVRLTVIATQPVKAASIVIDDNGAGSERRALEPVPGQEAAYVTEFVLRKSTQYRIYLMNEQKRENPDQVARPITVRPDKAPTVTLVSPMGTTKVRPDDTVPVRFSAQDDFGVMTVKALVQGVDGKEAVELPLKINGALGEAKVEGDAGLALGEALRELVPPGAKAPKRVTLQLKVIDNREPSPQAGLSEKVTLDLDPNAAPLAQRLDKEATKDLGDALKKATKQLEDAEKKLGDLQRKDQGRTLTESDAKGLAEAGQKVAEARKQLAEAAQQAEASRYSDIARQVREVSETQLKRAEEEVVKSQLASDQAPARKASSEAARRQVQEGRERLGQIGEHLTEAQRDQPAAQALEQLADQQKKLAEQLAQNPNDPALRQQQKELQKKLDEVIRQNPQLQKPAADAQQSKVKELDRKLQQIEESQKPLKDSSENQAAAATASDRARELGAKQEELNKQINDFAQKQGETLRQAGAQAPEPAKQESIVKDLKENRLQEAGTGQKSAASQLEQAARKLEQQQKRAAGTGSSREKAAQDVKDAEGLQQQAEELKKAVEQAKANHNPPTRSGDPENKQAQKLAEQIRKEAQQLSQNPAAKEQAQNAAKTAEASRKAALDGKGEAAAQGLSEAAGQLQQAAQAAQNAAGSPEAQAQTGAAAEQARRLAEQQKALGEQAGQLSKSQDEATAARSNAASTAERQQQLSDRLSEAARDARDLQQQAQGAAQELSDKAGKAAQALEQAAQAQREAAQATRNLDATGAAGKQTQATEQVGEARETLGGKPDQKTAGGAEGAGGKPGSPQGTPGAQGKPSAAQSVQGARAAQQEAAKGNPTAARQAAEQLAEASRQLLPGPGNGAGQPTGMGQTGQGPTAAQGQPGGPGGPAGMPGGTPGGTPGGPGTGGMMGQGSTPGMGGGTAGQGVQLSNGGRSGEMPKEVGDVGLSPSEWAKLPARMQSELLHSAQQPAPPGYRDMIKNYYSKIARMQGENEGGAR